MRVYTWVRIGYYLRIVFLNIALSLALAIPITSGFRRFPDNNWREVAAFLLMLVLPSLVGAVSAKVSFEFIEARSPFRWAFWTTLAILPAISGVAGYLVNLWAPKFPPWLVEVMRALPILWCCAFFCFWSALVFVVFGPELGRFPLTAEREKKARRLLTVAVAKKSCRVLAVALTTIFSITLLVLFGPEAETVSKHWIAVLGKDLHPPKGLAPLRDFSNHFVQLAMPFFPLFLYCTVALLFSWKRIPIEHLLVWREIRRKQRLKRHCCPKCSYSRLGLPQGAACPECGAPAP